MNIDYDSASEVMPLNKDLSKMEMYFSLQSVADPGFPRGGGANTPGGRQHDFAKFLPKTA